MSEDSVHLVTQVVDAVQPNVLMLELCPQRTGLLMPPSSEEEGKKESGKKKRKRKKKRFFSSFSCIFSGQKNHQSALQHAKQVMANGQGLSGAFQLALGYFYQKVGSEIKIQPGAEFRAALQAVQRGCVPCQLVLGDRAIGVTIQRAWCLLPLSEKFKLMLQLAKAMVTPISKADIERMKQSDVLTELMLEFCEYFPSLSRVLLQERDLYLARSVLQIAYSPEGGNRVVAVVGLGHLKGVEDALNRWKNTPGLAQDECKDLTHVPATPWTARRMGILFLLIFIVLCVLSFFGLRMLYRLIF